MKIWYDISGIYSWHGNFTGIQRVVFNLGKQLHDDDIDAGFFVYRHGNFHEVDFALLEARLRERPAANSVVRKSGEGLKLGALHHHAMVSLKDIARRTPAAPYLKSAYGGLRKTYRTTRSSLTQNRPKMSLFSAGDTVIVVDGNWQFHNYADVLISTKKRTNFKLVHFVHDLTPVKNPALASIGADKILGDYFEQIIPAADIIIADSESSKRDTEWFIHERNLKKPKLDVLILGDNFSEGKKVTSQKPEVTIPSNFILSVSTIEIRKNYTALYYVYKLANEKGIELPHLVIVGKKGWMAEEAYVLLTKDPELQSQITILRGIPDEELEWLYANCKFTVFPSFYEGWGMPVAESFVHGKVCISSNTSSMPEVGKDLAVYISPYDTNQLMETIALLATDTSRLLKLEANIQTKYHTRTWANAHADMLKIIDQN